MTRALDPTTFFHMRLVDKQGTVCPRAGVTLMYTTEPDPENMTEKPVMVISFCSPLDNYSKAKGRSTCMSRFLCGDPHHVVSLGKPLTRADNQEAIVRQIVMDRWNELVETKWAGRGIFPVRKKNQHQPEWEDFELRLTKKKRKAKSKQ
jgi:hypothetical protein